MTLRLRHNSNCRTPGRRKRRARQHTSRHTRGREADSPPQAWDETAADASANNPTPVSPRASILARSCHRRGRRRQVQRFLAGVMRQLASAARRNMFAPVNVGIRAGSSETGKRTSHDPSQCSRSHVCDRHRLSCDTKGERPIARSRPARAGAFGTNVGAAAVCRAIRLRVRGASRRVQVIQVSNRRAPLTSVRAYSLTARARRLDGRHHPCCNPRAGERTDHKDSRTHADHKDSRAHHDARLLDGP